MHIAAIGSGAFGDIPVPCFFLPFELPDLYLSARDDLLTSLGLLHDFDLFQNSAQRPQYFNNDPAAKGEELKLLRPFPSDSS